MNNVMSEADVDALGSCVGRIDDLEYMLHIDRAALADFEAALSHIAEEGGMIGAYAALVLDNRARREYHKSHADLEAYRYRVDVLGLPPLSNGDGEPE